MILVTREQIGPISGLLVITGLVLGLCMVCPVTAAHPKKILIIPFHVEAGKLQAELESFSNHAEKSLRSAITSLKEGFVVENEEVTKRLLKGKGAPGVEEEARELASHAGCDAVIYGFLNEEDGKCNIKWVMWDAVEKRVMLSADVKGTHIRGLPRVLRSGVKQIIVRLRGSPRLHFYKPGIPSNQGPRSGIGPSLVDVKQDTGPWVSQKIYAPLQSLDIGDLDGDKKNETVFLGRTTVSIGRFDQGSLKTLTKVSDSSVRYLFAEVEDIDSDGVAELILCYWTPKGLESAIVRYTDRVFRVSTKFSNVILRTIKDPNNDKKRILVGQRTDVDDIFSGEMVRFEIVDREPNPVGTVTLPPGTLLTSYVSGRFGNRSTFLQIILNQDQRLMVFDRNNRLLASVADRIYGIDRHIRLHDKRGSKSIMFPGRMIISDTDGDGENELLVGKRTSAGSFVQGLTWDGKQLREKWKTVGSSGLISDLRIRDFKNQGIKSLVLILIEPRTLFSFRTPCSLVYAYDLGH
jgi:hypothetical protein